MHPPILHLEVIYYQSFADRDNAEKVRFDSKKLIADTEAQTTATQKDVTKKIAQRMHDINYWKNALQQEIEDMRHETKLLEAQKKRVENALDATQVPLMIATDCLRNRERRQGIDLVRDNAEVELMKEVVLIKKVQDLLKRTIKEADKQMRLNRAAKHILDKDWSDKFEALELDNHCGRLTNQSTNVQYKEGLENIPGSGNSVPLSWAQFTHDNIVRDENERMASTQLRAIIDEICTDVANDMREQASVVERSLAKRLEELHDTRAKLSNHLNKVCTEVARQEKNIRDLQKAIRDKEAPMKVSHTRLATRTNRPGMDLCNDPVQNRLLEEVDEIQGSIEALKAKLAEAESSRADLMETRMALEKEIAIKKNSIFIDHDKCLTERTRFPTISRLAGYQ